MDISKKTAQAWKMAMDRGKDKVLLLCDSRLRAPLAGMLSRAVPPLPVIAYDEIVMGAEVDPIETISVGPSGAEGTRQQELVGVSG